MKQALARIRALSWRERGLLLEAGLLLGAAAAAIGLVSFPRLARSAGGATRPPGRAPLPDELRELRWAIEAMARRVPFRSKCFERGLTAQWMLGRRGIDSTLFYGIARDADQALSAHVWVRAGGCNVVGCENAADYATVARFPPEDTSPPASIR